MRLILDLRDIKKSEFHMITHEQGEEYRVAGEANHKHGLRQALLFLYEIVLRILDTS